MHFALSKLTIDLDSPTLQDGKILGSLVEKIRARFKVCAKGVIESQNESVHASLVVSSLGNGEEKLAQLVDSISQFCEESGYGRVVNQETFIDHIDVLLDDSEN